MLSSRRALPNIESLLTGPPMEALRYACYPAPEQFSDGFSPAHWAHALRARSELQRPRPLALYADLPADATIPVDDLLREELEQLERLLGRRAEIVQLHVAGARRGEIVDGALERLLERMREAFAFVGNAELSVETTAGDATPAVLRGFATLGFNRLVIRAHSGARRASIPVLQATDATLVDAAGAARESGFRSFGIDLLYGVPGQSPEDLAAAVERVVALRPAYINLNAFGTRPAGSRTSGDTPPDATERAAILARGIERLVDAGYAYGGFDVFVPGQAEASFEGRTGQNAPQRCGLGYPIASRCDFVGVGPAALSSLGEVAAQNALSTEAYMALVAKGRPPVTRGLQLSLDDQLRREVIHALEFRFAVAFSALEHKYGIEFARYFAQELETLDRLHQEGLVEVYEDAIEVPEGGRPLVRVLCAIFDRYRARDRTAAQQSKRSA